MDSRSILKVEVNLANRVCIISDSNGTVLLRKPITEAGYSKASIVKGLGKVKEVMQYTPEEKLPNADMIVYGALKELDDTNKTNYGKEYLKIVIDKIPYQAPGKDEPILEKILRKVTGRRLESEASYLQRAREIKAKELSNLGLSIAYSDISEIQNSSELSPAEKDVAIAIVNRQKLHNGIQTGELVQFPEREDDTPDMEAVKKFLEEEKREQEEQEEQQVEEQLIAPEGNPKDKPLDSKDKDDEDKKNGNGNPKGKDKPKGPKQPPKAPKPKNKKKKIEGIKEGRAAYRKRLQEGNKSKADIPEGVSAPTRETKKQRQERISREAAEQRRIANEKKAEKTKKAPIDGPKVDDIKKPIIISDALNKEKMSVRFTRKLKDARDSIREKVYKPHKRLINICGCVAIAGLVLLAGFKGYQHLNNSNSTSVISKTTSFVQTVGSEEENARSEIQVKPATELSAVKQETTIKGEPNLGATVETPTQASTSTNTKGYMQKVVTQSETTLNNQENTIMTDSGKYFSSPDGTGDYGNFENYQDCKKEMTIIGLNTDKGYYKIGTSITEKDEEGNINKYIQIKTNNGDIIIDANDVELAESIVRQTYPNAEYMSVHFEAEHKDGTTTTLGWVRSDISEKNIDKARTHMQIEDLER